MLLLVDFAFLDAGVRAPETIDGATDLENHRRIVDGDELWAHDRGVRAERLLDHDPYRRRVHDHVVVAHEEEGGALHGLDRLVRCTTEPGFRRAGAQTPSGVLERRGS